MRLNGCEDLKNEKAERCLVVIIIKVCTLWGRNGNNFDAGEKALKSGVQGSELVSDLFTSSLSSYSFKTAFPSRKGKISTFKITLE